MLVSILSRKTILPVVRKWTFKKSSKQQVLLLHVFVLWSICGKNSKTHRILFFPIFATPTGGGKAMYTICIRIHPQKREEGGAIQPETH